MSDQDLEHMSSGEADLRYLPRWEVSNRVMYRTDGENDFHEGRTKDINCAGACIVGNTPVAPQHNIEMTVQLSPKTTIRLNARILWAKFGANETQMGVTFYGASEETQDSIFQHAFELDRDKFLKQWYKGWDNS